MKDGKESQGRSEETQSQPHADASQETNLGRRSFLQAGALAAGAALAPLSQAGAQSDDAASQDFAALSGE